MKFDGDVRLGNFWIITESFIKLGSLISKYHSKEITTAYNSRPINLQVASFYSEIQKTIDLFHNEWLKNHTLVNGKSFIIIQI